MDEQNPSGSGTGRKVLVAVLAISLLGSIGFYVSGVSLKSLLFGISSQEGEKVGVVKAVTGQLKRQPKDSLEFLEAKADADLFDEDTVMTGPEDRATLELFDGSVLELDPGSLVRLSFENAQGVGGIERRVLVDIVAGNVKGDMTRPKLVVRRGGKPLARPSPISSPIPSPSPSPIPEPSPAPSPSPSPTPRDILTPDMIEIAEPTVGQVFSVPAGSKPPLKQALVFEVPKAPSAKVMMILRNATGKELLRKTVTAHRGRGGLLASFERPGGYSVELRNPDGTKIGNGISAGFTVAADFEGIEAEPPLVGGEVVDSNRFTGKRLQDFEVTLRWKPIKGVENYRVVVENAAGKKLIDQVVKGASFTMPKGQVATDALTYRIRADFPNGYNATSKTRSFMFSFVSPAQTLPKDGETVSLADPEIAKQKGILFSWQRTNFSKSYLFEIAFDPEFTHVMKKVTVKATDNFLIYRHLKPRDYWWRVRAVAGDLQSPPGAPFKITVTP